MKGDTVHTIDLHIHTRLSDGTDSPEELLELVRAAGIQIFSVTDHDGIQGSVSMPDLLSPGDPGFIRGVEFSCKDRDGKYHILGYGYDPENPRLQALLEKGHGFRINKTRDRLDFLREQFGFDFPEDEIEEILTMNNPGKPHIAGLMIRHGYAETIREAIDVYIDQKQFPERYITPEEAIEAISASGGISVLAHAPWGSGDEVILGRDLEERVERLVGYGLQGVEGYYSGFTEMMKNQILRQAELYGLYVTAGSDFHGKNKLVELGDTELSDVAAAPEGLWRFLEDVEILEG